MFVARAPSYRRMALGELGAAGCGCKNCAPRGLGELGRSPIEPQREPATHTQQCDRGGCKTVLTPYGQEKQAKQFAASYPDVPAHWGTFTRPAGFAQSWTFTPSETFKTSPIAPHSHEQNPVGYFGWSPAGKEILDYLSRLERGTSYFVNKPYVGPQQVSQGGEKRAKAKAALQWAISTGHVSHRGEGGGVFKSQILPILAVAAPAIVGLAAPGVFAAGAAAGSGMTAAQAAEAAALTAGGGITGAAGAGAGAALSTVGTAAATATAGAGLLSQVGSAIKDAGQKLVTDQVKSAVVSKAQEFIAEKLGPPLPEGFLDPGQTVTPEAPAGFTPEQIKTALGVVALLGALFLR